ncbi:MAG: hypothetical protein GXO23_01075 [Crenarchaeota archaeon]|nr:hypothetical protein [Thermoproteota archaeon]
MINYGVVKAEIELLGLINMRDDYYAALTLDYTLSKLGNVKRLSNLVSELDSNSCIVLMPGRGLERIDRIPLDFYDLVVVCDSAVDYLYSRYGVLRRLRDLTVLMVTDLDSEPSALAGFCREVRPIVIVHAHGDNIEKLWHISSLEYSKICGTCQVEGQFRYVEYCQGFTDGDRALVIASHVSRHVDVLGLDIEGSLSYKGINSVKRVKLDILRYYIDSLRCELGLLVY